MKYAIALALALLATPAWASRYPAPGAAIDVAAQPTYPIEIIAPLRHGYHGHHSRHYEVTRRHSRHRHYYASQGYERIGSRPADCYGIPWCGCYMRHIMGVASREYNLARNWAHYGHATSPHVGAIVVWSHHVGKIVGQVNGEWVVLSGNDGHAVRERPRSLAGAIAFRE